LDVDDQEMQMRTLLAFLLPLLCMNSVAAQKPVPANVAGEAHAVLARMAGNWETQARFWMSKDISAPPIECTANVSAQMIMSGRFLFQKVEGQCMGQPLEAIGVIDYDNSTGQYQATSFSNTETSISRHVGERNDAGDIVLHLSYQDKASGVSVHRRTVRRMISENEWLETAHEKRNDAEQKVMEIRARKIIGGDTGQPRRNGWQLIAR
jgi:hypothetical protein